VVGAKMGVLWSLEGDLRTRVTDRFHLGGPTDVRGFKHLGIGPKDRSMIPFFFGMGGLMVDDSVGGEAFLAYSASVMFPVPNVPKHWPLRLQTFVSAGSLLPVDQSKKGFFDLEADLGRRHWANLFPIVEATFCWCRNWSNVSIADS
jgi:outer membrane protein insertion porin family